MTTLELLKSLGFKGISDFKFYMLSKAKLNEWGAKCYEEKRQDVMLSYSNNCTKKFGIGTAFNGMWTEKRI